MTDHLLPKKRSDPETKNNLSPDEELKLLNQKDIFLEEKLFNTAKDFGLTKRELQVLTLIISGRTNEQIAKLLCLTRRMIEYHRRSLMEKLNVNNTANLVKRAIAMGIV